MWYDLLFRGMLVGLVSSITVGPVAVLCIQRTLSKSRQSGLASGVGVACADTLLATIAYFCYSVMQSWLDQYALFMRVTCGIMIVAVGVYICLQNPVTQIRRNRAGVTNLWQDFASMFGFTLANMLMIVPYIFVFFGMFSIETTECLSMNTLLLGALHLIGFFGGAICWWFSLTSLINIFRNRFRPRHMLWINRIAGCLITLLGAYTIISTFIEVFVL
ncbi:MAG: LysE family transporter [Rikenellaceae bacterium]|nr:LysE family transporter [Rikenellaceae bacterium]